MKLSIEEVRFIKQDVRNRGMYSEELLDELTDHICSMIEARGSENFNFFEVHKLVVDEFMPSNFNVIQELIINNKRNNKMKTVKLLSVCLATYATLILLISLLFNFNGSANALRLTAFIVYAATALLLGFFLIRFRLKDNNLRIITGLFGYIASYILIGFGIKEINADAGTSVLNVVPYLSIIIVVFCGVFFYRFRKNVARLQ